MGWTLENPIGMIPAAGLESSPVPGFMLAFLAILSALSLIIRFWREGYVERQQIKWFLLACGIFVLIALFLTFLGGDWGELTN